MDKTIVVLFTMDGCPFCDMMKDQLVEGKIEFINRNIDEYRDEYDLFVEATGSEYVPAFMIIENLNETVSSKAFVPERDYQTIEEGVEIIKNILK